MNIYVGNLGQQTSETQLRDLFATHGEVESVKIITDNITGRSRGFAFVEMTSKAAGENAIQELNNTKLDTQYITVNEARPKTTQSGNYGSSYRSSGNRRY